MLRRHLSSASGRRSSTTPRGRKFFRQFANTDEAEPGDRVRRRTRPASPGPPIARRRRLRPARHPDRLGTRTSAIAVEEEHWVFAGRGRRLPARRGPRDQARRLCRSRSSATARTANGTPRENVCPHKREAVLSRGIVGDQGGVPEGRLPACIKRPFHSRSGACLSGESYRVRPSSPSERPGGTRSSSSFLRSRRSPRLDGPGPRSRPAFLRRGLRLRTDRSPTPNPIPEPNPSMNLRDFRNASATRRAWISAFLYFDVSFMVWLLPGALGQFDRARTSTCPRRRKASWSPSPCWAGRSSVPCSAC